MPTPSTATWPRPKSADEFEDIALDALKTLWKDPLASRLGRSGQAQCGIDILGQDNNNGGRHVAAQCKNVEKLTLAAINEIVDATLGYQPTLTEFLVVISGPRDAKLQVDVQVLSEARTSASHFGVRMLFWDDLCGAIAREPALVVKHWPCIAPTTGATGIPSIAAPVATTPTLAVHQNTKAPPYALVTTATDPALLVPGAVASAVALIRKVSPPRAPTREVIVVPYSVPASLLVKSQAIEVARSNQLRGRFGQPVYPVMELQKPKDREPQGLLWDENPELGWHAQFALGFDGSFAHRETVVESIRSHRIWGTGVGLFSTLGRVIDAVIYARRILRAQPPSRAWLLLTLDGITGQRLAFDYDDCQPKASHLFAGNPTTSSPSIHIGLNFDLSISAADVLDLALAAGEDLVYYFGWNWRKEWVVGELKKILDEVEQAP